MDHRLVARVIGIIDMVLAMLGIASAVTILIILLAAGGSQIIMAVNQNNGDKGSDSEYADKVAGVSSNVFTAIVYVVMIVTCAVGLLQMYASWKLIQGTKQDLPPGDGVRFCRIWRNITIFFIIIQVLSILKIAAGVGTLSQVTPNIIYFVFHVFAVIFVNKYMDILRNIPITTAMTNTIQMGHQMA